MPRRRRLGLLGLLRSTQKMGRALQALTAPPKVARKTPATLLKKPVRGKGDWVKGVALGPAGIRRYQLFRPPGLARHEKLPLIVMLHGCGQDAEAFSQSTRMNRLAVQKRFLVLYPEQDRRANLQGCWNWFEIDSGRAYHEAATLLAAVDQVCALYPVDPAQVAVAGLSAGASMAALLATRYPTRFAAVAVHSGIPPGTAHSTVSAIRAMRGNAATATAPDASHWPPLLVIHGRQDRVVALSNGEAAAVLWADAGHAKRYADRSVKRGSRYPMTVTDFKRQGLVIATLCLIDGLGHAWSGGADKRPFSDAKGPDASAMIWAFAARQFAQSKAA